MESCNAFWIWNFMIDTYDSSIRMIDLKHIGVENLELPNFKLDNLKSIFKLSLPKSDIKSSKIMTFREPNQFHKPLSFSLNKQKAQEISWTLENLYFEFPLTYKSPMKDVSCLLSLHGPIPDPCCIWFVLIWG